MRITKSTITVLTFFAATFAFPLTASADQCIIKSFSVNDYGRVGPERDARELLDEYVRDWADREGVKHYRMGPKSVACKLFLDVGLFNEYTCRAAARVCWKGARRRHDGRHTASIR